MIRRIAISIVFAVLIVAWVLALMLVVAKMTTAPKIRPASAVNRVVSDCSLAKESKIFKKVVPSVIMITVFNGKSELGIGSGFFVDTPRGIRVMTAGHLISTKPGNYIYQGTIIINLKTFEAAHFTMTVDKVDRRDDLALLDFPAKDLSFPVRPLEIRNSVPEIGDPALIVGAPEGYFPQLAAGFSSRLVLFPGGAVKYLQLSINATLGNSGSPVIDCDGRVIGVLLAVASPDHAAASLIRPGYITNKFINSK